MTVKRARELNVWLTAGGVAVQKCIDRGDGKAHCYRYPSGAYAGLLWVKNLRRPISEEARLIREPGARAFPRKRRGATIAWGR